MRTLTAVLLVTLLACKPKEQPNYLGVYIATVGDSAVNLFQPCNSRERFLVEGRARPALDNAYTEVRHLPGVPIYVELKAEVINGDVPAGDFYTGKIRADTMFTAFSTPPRTCFPEDRG